MPLRRAIPVLRRENPDQTRAFWGDLLGFEAAVDEPGFMMLVSPDVGTTQLIVDAAYAGVQARGLERVFCPRSARTRLALEPSAFLTRHDDGRTLSSPLDRPGIDARAGLG
jgi:catechol 2,3-dioxygenase-like lactoylglutathione lyase family enzyme